MKEVKQENADLVKDTRSRTSLRVVQRAVASDACCEPVLRSSIEMGREFLYWIEIPVVIKCYTSSEQFIPVNWFINCKSSTKLDCKSLQFCCLKLICFCFSIAPLFCCRALLQICIYKLLLHPACSLCSQSVCKSFCMAG